MCGGGGLPSPVDGEEDIERQGEAAAKVTIAALRQALEAAARELEVCG